MWGNEIKYLYKHSIKHFASALLSGLLRVFILTHTATVLLKLNTCTWTLSVILILDENHYSVKPIMLPIVSVLFPDLAYLLLQHTMGCCVTGDCTNEITTRCNNQNDDWSSPGFRSSSSQLTSSSFPLLSASKTFYNNFIISLLNPLRLKSQLWRRLQEFLLIQQTLRGGCWG